MDSIETGKRYDAIASWWFEQMKGTKYGLGALRHALKFVGNGRKALDVGCGCEGRFIKTLRKRGFECSGLDISQEMISLARKRDPRATFFVGDICTWRLPQRYDLITAWDSLFHLPLNSHKPVIEKLCRGLSTQGTILFTCGDGDAPGTVRGGFGGKDFEYSSLGVAEFCRLLWRCGCTIQHIEYDHYPENHVFIIARKGSVGRASRNKNA